MDSDLLLFSLLVGALSALELRVVRLFPSAASFSKPVALAAVRLHNLVADNSAAP